MRQDLYDFRETVWEYYRHNGRTLPWRLAEPDGTFDAYKIFVSEIMLQQTQVSRVIPKYETFISRFPTVSVLAAADFSDVLLEWMGLGYNRRAKFLKSAADMIKRDFKGVVPDTIANLTLLPGVGINTAAAVMAYAYNKPTVFIETNIRAVYIKHFFEGATDVHDNQLKPLVEATIDPEQPREWYWALMDYGSWLKSNEINYSRHSRHHVTQSGFEGSLRQLRAKVLRAVLAEPQSVQQLYLTLRDPRTKTVVEMLIRENFLVEKDSILCVYGGT